MIKKAILFLALLPLAAAIAAAQVKIVGGPYLQNVTDTSFTVVWTTNMDAVGWVEVAPDDGTHFYNVERPQYFDKRGFGRKPIGKLHKVTVSGLEPGTVYRYRPMCKGVLEQGDRARIIYTEGYGEDILRKEALKVQTKKTEYEELKFAVVNDVHEKDSLFRVLFQDSKGKYDFVCFNGDMTSDVKCESDIMKYYMKSAGELFACETPLYIVRGNHEYRGNGAIRYIEYMDTPTGKTYYTASYGDFFFIFLDSGEDKPDSDIRNLDIMITKQYIQEEAEWLRKVVRTKEFQDSKVRIAFCHMPPDPNGWYGNSMVSKYLVPTLNEAGIDLMLCAHIHKYRYDEPGAKGADFPIVCNKNVARLDATVTHEKISLTITDPDGKVIATNEFTPGR